MTRHVRTLSRGELEVLHTFWRGDCGVAEPTALGAGALQVGRNREGNTLLRFRLPYLTAYNENVQKPFTIAMLGPLGLAFVILDGRHTDSVAAMLNAVLEDCADPRIVRREPRHERDTRAAPETRFSQRCIDKGHAYVTDAWILGDAEFTPNRPLHVLGPLGVLAHRAVLTARGYTRSVEGHST